MTNIDDTQIDNVQLEAAISLLEQIHNSNLHHAKFGSGENEEAKQLDKEFKQFPRDIRKRAQTVASQRRQAKMQRETDRTKASEAQSRSETTSE